MPLQEGGHGGGGCGQVPESPGAVQSLIVQVDYFQRTEPQSVMVLWQPYRLPLERSFFSQESVQHFLAGSAEL